MNCNSKYVLVDPRPIAAEAPYTFWLPRPSEVARIAKGDFVKLIFECEQGVERMWVIVTDVGTGELTRTLHNEPRELPLQWGEEIRFCSHHIIAVQPQIEAGDSDTRRQYWARCMVDSCVVSGAEPVEYIYREAPDMGGEGDVYPDSGWRIRGRQGATTDAGMDERSAEYVTIGVVLNKDDSWLYLIDSPIGSAFMRNFTTGEYLPVKRGSSTTLQ